MLFIWMTRMFRNLPSPLLFLVAALAMAPGADASLDNSTPNFSAVGAAAGGQLGAAVSDAGDLNGDGYRDLAVAAPDLGNGQAGEGLVYIYFGSANGIAASPSLTLEVNQAGARFSASVSGGGDVNGDGYDDLLVGATLWDEPGVTNGGRGFLFLGGAAMDSSFDASFGPSQASSELGGSVAIVGDVNADGYADMLLGARLYDIGAATNAGRAFLYFGAAVVDVGIDAQLGSSQTNSEYGTSVAGIGDVDGNGRNDILVGAPRYTDGQTNEGAAFLHLAGNSGSGFATSPSLIIEGGLAEARFGRTVQGLGDVNGDGFADFALHATDELTAVTNKGRVRVYYGGSTVDATADRSFSSPLTSIADFGQALASGDVNGDGYSDLVFGAPRYTDVGSEEGRLIVHLGGEGALAATPHRSFSRAIAGERFGGAMAVVDVNGDGYADIVAGAPGHSSGSAGQGAFVVYHGGAVTAGSAQPAITATQVAGRLGFAVASGDLNGDGFADIAAGSDGHDGPPTDGGRVALYFGRATGLPAAADAQIIGSVVSARLGASVAIGDLNGDGIGDLIVGAPDQTTQTGTVTVYLGSAGSFDTVADLTLNGTQGTSQFGFSVAALGDINGDGFGDFAAGAPTFDGLGTDTGRVLVYFGAANLDGSADLTIEPATANSRAGSAIASAGDFNGDGFGDIAVGMPRRTVGGATEAGYVGIYFGGAAPNAVEDLALPGATANARMGSVLASAGDVNGDGYSDLLIGLPPANRARIQFGAASPTAAAFVDLTQGPDTAIGTALAGGDWNNDSYSDVLVGAPGTTGSGGAAIYLGGPGSFDTTADVQFSANQSASAQGRALALADVNGDGTADAITGAPGFDITGATDVGALHAYLGNTAGKANAVQQFTGTSAQPIYLNGRTAQPLTVAMDAYATYGRMRAKLQLETCPQSRPFGHTSCRLVASPTWTDIPAVGTGVLLSATASALSPGTQQWRARVVYAPRSVTATGITAPINPTLATPWRRQLGRADQQDVGVVTYAVGGTVSGLGAGLSVVLRNVVTGENLIRNANGAFSFGAAQTAGSTYTVIMQGQPVGQTCGVSNGTGTVGTANVSSIAVTCATSGIHTVGGSVSGLGTGLSVVLRNAVTGESLPLNANGAYVFTTAQNTGAAYDVSVQTQPTGQNCVVANGSGTIGTVNVTNVAVTCTTITYSVGGTISGLGAGLTVELRNTFTGENLVRNANGAYTFLTQQAAGANYLVSVFTQPAGQTCTVSNASGVIGTSNVSNVNVSCTGGGFTVGGSVSGLGTGLSVVLRNSVTGEDLTRNANGAYTFATAQAAGASYNVIVQTQPTGQTCTVANGSGTIGSANVSNVNVSCVGNSYTVGGSISGLGAGLSVVLRNTATGEDLTRNANGAYVFATSQAAGSSYNITVLTQPIGQNCSLSNASGVIALANVGNVDLSCSNSVDAVFANGFE